MAIAVHLTLCAGPALATGGRLVAAGGRLSRNHVALPLKRPEPTICPASLMSSAVCRTHPELGANTVFRSVIVPLHQRNAKGVPSALAVAPTICPWLLMAPADRKSV